jgi:hypothetical protein
MPGQYSNQEALMQQQQFSQTVHSQDEHSLKVFEVGAVVITSFSWY